MEKLSSGLRINKAGDDAAGLAISEKMRGQIRGLDMAAKNAQDGVSLLQTAEGALNETHSILQRMRELSVQSSNDTNTDADRESINTEINQLKEEIDRIGNTTEFNTKKLIDGSIGAKKAPGVDNAAIMASGLGKETAATKTGGTFNGVTDSAISDMSGDLSNQTINVDGATIKFDVTEAELDAVAYDTTGEKFASLLQSKINDAIDNHNTAYDGNVAKVSVTADSNQITIKSGSTGGTSGIKFDAATVASAGDANIWNIAGHASAASVDESGTEGEFSAAGLGAANSIAAGDKSTVSIDGVDLEVTWANVGAATSGNGSSAYVATDMDEAATDIASDINAAITKYNQGVPAEKRLENVTTSVKDGGIVVQSGSDKATSSIKFDKSTAAQALGLAGANSATQGGGVDFQIGANQTQTMKVTVEDMRTDALGIKDIDLSSKAGAQEAITKINDAIEKVSTQRSNLGAFQNRLEHTINNLGTSSENLTAAESRVRDVDMAKEMMEQTKNSILSQAAQAMLAQSNQMPQGVLQLLR
jgi:flagellin